MELGDKVKSLTESLGIKQCAECKERQNTLNQISRRGIIGGGLLAAFLAKNFVLSKAWVVFGAQIPLTAADIMGFLRLAVTEEMRLYLANGRHGDESDLLAAIAAHKQHFKPGDGAYNWMSQFRPGGAPEIFPGWTLNFVSRRTGQTEVPSDGSKGKSFATGYIFSLTNGKVVFVADELSWIYAAPFNSAIDISRLARAQDYPGAKLADNTSPLDANTQTTVVSRLKKTDKLPYT